MNSLSASDLREIYLIRVALESVLLREAVPILHSDSEVTDRLNEYLETMDRVYDDSDAWMVANEAFHRTMYELVAMPRATRVVSSLWAAVQPYLRVYVQEPASLRVAQGEHREMLAAIEQGDSRVRDRCAAGAPDGHVPHCRRETPPSPVDGKRCRRLGRPLTTRWRRGHGRQVARMRLFRPASGRRLAYAARSGAGSKKATGSDVSPSLRDLRHLAEQRRQLEAVAGEPGDDDEARIRIR